MKCEEKSCCHLRQAAVAAWRLCSHQHCSALPASPKLANEKLVWPDTKIELWKRTRIIDRTTTNDPRTFDMGVLLLQSYSTQQNASYACVRLLSIEHIDAAHLIRDNRYWYIMRKRSTDPKALPKALTLESPAEVVKTNRCESYLGQSLIVPIYSRGRPRPA